MFLSLGKEWVFTPVFFLVIKKLGEWYLIVDLRKLNKQQKKQSFRFIALQEILHLLNHGDFLTSLDI